MATKEPPTKVIFRKWRSEDHSVIALFPGMAATVGNPGHCESYAHVGQHGAADPLAVVRATRPAKPAEYKPLARELRRIGYRLKIVRRVSRKDYELRRQQLAR